MTLQTIDLEWARKHISGFAKMQDGATAVKQSEAEYAKLKQQKEERNVYLTKPLGNVRYRSP